MLLGKENVTNQVNGGGNVKLRVTESPWGYMRWLATIYQDWIVA